MRRSPLLFAAWFLPLAALVGAGLGCAAYRYQHAAPRAPTALAAAPVESSEPAAEFRALPAGAQAARVRGELLAAKEELARRGEYNCCIRPSCNHCLLDEGKCTCREEVEMMGPGCGECTQGWIEGRGAVPGFDIWQFLEQKVGEHRHQSSQPAEPEPPGHR